jgi:hypothetical protein
MYSASMKTKFITTTTIAVIAIIVAITTAATNVRAEGAFDEGWHTGESDYKNGDSKNPRCSSDIEASTCASYRAGYEAGWLSASLLWPEDRQEAMQN